MIAFLLPNEGSQKALEDFAVTVDQVERVTGLDFFPQLADKLEESLESQRNLEPWFPVAE